MAQGVSTPVRSRHGPGESKSIRVSGDSHAILSQLSEQSRQPLQAVADAAIEHYRRHRMMEATNQAYAALRGDTKAWDEFQQEMAVWDDTLADS